MAALTLALAAVVAVACGDGSGGAQVTAPATPASTAAVVPTPATGTPSSAGPTYKFEDGVSDRDREYIRRGIEIAEDWAQRNLGSSVESLFTVDVRAEVPPPYQPLAQAGGRRILIYAAHLRGARPVEIMRVAVHEYFHLLQQEHAWRGPGWLTEGSAEFVSYQALIDAELITYEEAKRAQGLSVNTTPPVPALRRTPPLHSGIIRGPMYSLFFQAVEFLTSRSGIGSLRSYWEVLPHYDDWRDAFQEAFGLDIDSFYLQFEEFRKKLESSDLLK